MPSPPFTSRDFSLFGPGNYKKVRFCRRLTGDREAPYTQSEIKDTHFSVSVVSGFLFSFPSVPSIVQRRGRLLLHWRRQKRPLFFRVFLLLSSSSVWEIRACALPLLTYCKHTSWHCLTPPPPPSLPLWGFWSPDPFLLLGTHKPLPRPPKKTVSGAPQRRNEPLLCLLSSRVAS